MAPGAPSPPYKHRCWPPGPLSQQYRKLERWGSSTSCSACSCSSPPISAKLPSCCGGILSSLPSSSGSCSEPSNGDTGPMSSSGGRPPPYGHAIVLQQRLTALRRLLCDVEMDLRYNRFTDMAYMRYQQVVFWIGDRKLLLFAILLALTYASTYVEKHNGMETEIFVGWPEIQRHLDTPDSGGTDPAEEGIRQQLALSQATRACHRSRPMAWRRGV